MAKTGDRIGALTQGQVHSPQSNLCEIESICTFAYVKVRAYETTCFGDSIQVRNLANTWTLFRFICNGTVRL